MTKKFFLLFFLLFFSNIQSDDRGANEELLLYSQFGEFCTMCEAIILCNKDKSEINHLYLDQDSYLLFHIETRTFWSQLSTIWEFFIRNFDGYEIKGHSRPAKLYSSQNGKWTSESITAEISIDPNLIKLGEIVINRETENWSKVDKSEIGFCERLPLWETLSYIDERTK